MRSFVDKKNVDERGFLIVQREAREIFPIDFESCKEAITGVKNRESVVLNFQGIPVERAQRTLDFIAGAVFVMDGQVKKIKNKKYLIVPCGVKVRKIREKK